MAAHSKWLEVKLVPSLSKRCNFSRTQNGRCKTWLTGNRPSLENNFNVKANGIIHIISTPYHLASNDFAERAEMSRHL